MRDPGVENLARALFGDEHYEQFQDSCLAEFDFDAQGAAQIIRRHMAEHQTRKGNMGNPVELVGKLRFCIEIDLKWEDIATWEPARIAELFRGIATAQKAVNDR